MESSDKKMVLGLLTNVRFIAGFGLGVFINQELGTDKVRFYVNNPQVAIEDATEKIKSFRKSE
jgi:hypothetical protein